jgi:hypothetical protein
MGTFNPAFGARIAPQATSTSGTADSHGRFNGTIKVKFNPGKPTKASITVEAKSADGSTVDSTWITVTPLR